MSLGISLEIKIFSTNFLVGLFHCIDLYRLNACITWISVRNIVVLIQGGRPFSRSQGKRRKMVQKKLMGEHLKCINLGFPWQSSVKTLSCQCRGPGFDPWLGNQGPACHLAGPKKPKYLPINIKTWSSLVFALRLTECVCGSPEAPSLQGIREDTVYRRTLSSSE